jgi:H+/Cl- antiporter ClcA
MFQVAPFVTILGYAVIALFGGVIGLLVGILACRFRRNDSKVVLWDGLLGCVGSVVAVIGCAIVPWPTNTVSRSLSPGIHVDSTMDRFQHPYIAAVIVAAILPAVNEWFRAKR